MRSGHLRGISLAIAMAVAATCTGLQARANLFHKTIPRETLAMDYRTGSVMMAPPIPSGLYTADPIGCIQNAAGSTMGCVHGLISKVKGLCTKCGGSACGSCGGKGWKHGQACNGCGGDGCSTCGSGLMHGHGKMFGHGGTLDDGSGLCGNGAGMSFVGHGPVASSQYLPATIVPAKAVPQSIAPSSQMPVGACGGCLGTGKLLHGGGCGMCGGSGLCGNGKGLFKGMFCGRCKGAGCGDCMGDGGMGNACGSCGGAGCGKCMGLGGKGLGGMHSGLGSKAHGILAKITHKGDIKYFTGAGGPVPLTPGYVPYINVTKSPRDFFAYPPFSDQFP